MKKIIEGFEVIIEQEDGKYDAHVPQLLVHFFGAHSIEEAIEGITEEIRKMKKRFSPEQLKKLTAQDVWDATMSDENIGKLFHE